MGPDQGEEGTVAAREENLCLLGLEYADLLLVHFHAILMVLPIAAGVLARQAGEDWKGCTRLAKLEPLAFRTIVRNTFRMCLTLPPSPWPSTSKSGMLVWDLIQRVFDRSVMNTTSHFNLSHLCVVPVEQMNSSQESSSLALELPTIKVDRKSLCGGLWRMEVLSLPKRTIPSTLHLTWICSRGNSQMKNSPRSMQQHRHPVLKPLQLIAN